MNDTVEHRICKDLEEEKHEIETIEHHIERIKERLLDRVPEHFSRRDVVNALFASLTIGVTFILKGATVKTAVDLDTVHAYLLVIVTVFVLFVEIYYIGYTRIKNKNQRRFGQFLLKRLTALYGIALLTSISLVYLFNLNASELVHSFTDVLKIVVLVAFPCAVGAAIPSILKKY